MKKINKYLYGWKIQSNSGFGWDDECFEETRKEAVAQLKCYRENAYGRFAVRAVKGRELNPLYSADRGEL